MKIPQLLLLSFAVVSIHPSAADAPAKQPAASEQAAPAKPFTNIDITQFENLRTNKNTVVLDVRTKKEFDAGHIPGAINVDVNAPDFAGKAAQLDKSKTYLVHCAAGVRSVKACNALAPLKFEKLYNLEGGYKAWENAGHKGEIQ